MLDLFEKKSINDFSKSIRRIFNLMTISRKYDVVGSASFKNARYVSDYDLNELFETATDTNSILHSIYLMFKKKFQNAEQDPSIFITDFKCGMDSDGSPLRWEKDDIEKGYKILKDKRKLAFQDCILMKTTMKLDEVALIEGVYHEFSDNYFIKLGNDANFFPHDIQRDHILNSLKHAFDEYYYASHNYMKGLKRCFSYYMLEDKQKNIDKLTKLFNFFNSQVGLLYKCRSELDTIQTVINQKFRSPRKKDIDFNISIVLGKSKIFKLAELEKSLISAMNSKNDADMIRHLDEAKDFLLKVINTCSLRFVEKNKSILLY